MSMLIATSDALKSGRCQHGFFGRAGGVSTGLYASLNCGPGSHDDKAHVTENRSRVATALGGGPLYTLHQHHSADCKLIGANDDPSHHPKADAMVTDRPGVILGILTADCGPVLLADRQAGIIGAAHAGWRGATGGVLDNTIKTMISLGASADNIHAALGPTIGPEDYEVGADFITAVTDADDNAADYIVTDDSWPKPHFDLPGYIGARLIKLGVGRVDLDCARSTYARPQDYFSFRYNTHQNEADYGRMIAAICLT